MDKADISWLLVSTLLVLMMAVPGLALFYGGLVRSKNVLSVLLQVLCTFALGLLLWFAYGYSLAFTEGNAVFGGLSRTFFSGMFTPADGTYALSGTLTELLFASFQATFAGITCALIVGSFAERARFSRRAGVHGDLVHLCLYPDRAHGLVRLRNRAGPAQCPRRAGFRRRHRGAHQCGGGRTGRRVRGGPTHRLWPRSDAAAHPADDLHRRGAAVGRLVRLQRRLVAGGQRRRPPWRSSTP
ncbi:ammonium transporter [Bordetella pertussis]|nr:ammonium transporter [Bordetella pertussis]